MPVEITDYHREMYSKAYGRTIGQNEEIPVTIDLSQIIEEVGDEVATKISKTYPIQKSLNEFNIE